MDRTAAVLATLVLYMLALLALGLIAERRTADESDFLLGGRRLGPIVTAISASASSSSVWTLLGVSGYAYRAGFGALWLFPACVGGFALNWYCVAERLRRGASERNAMTLTELLAGRSRGQGFGPARVAASVIVVVSLTAYVAAQFQGAGKSLEASFGMSTSGAILTGSAVVIAYAALGGFWAASLTDTLQGAMMAAVAVALPIAALLAAGGPEAAYQRVVELTAAGAFRADGHDLLVVLALLGIGLGYPGQPHVVNRFMAARGAQELRRARRISMGWAVIVYAGMIVLGLCGRVLHETPLADSEQVFLVLSDELFGPILAGLTIAAVLAAIMSTADSQLLTAAAAISHDLGWRGRDARGTLLRSRLVVLVTSFVAIAVAGGADARIFDAVLFAWSAIGAAFGPLLLVTLWRGPVAPLPTLLAMASGFALSVVAYQLPATRGGVFERIVPSLVAGAIAYAGARPRVTAPARPPASSARP